MPKGYSVPNERYGSSSTVAFDRNWRQLILRKPPCRSGANDGRVGPAGDIHPLPVVAARIAWAVLNKGPQLRNRWEATLWSQPARAWHRAQVRQGWPGNVDARGSSAKACPLTEVHRAHTISQRFYSDDGDKGRPQTALQ